MANITTQSFFSVCLSARHYYSGKFTYTINTSRHFAFEYALVMYSLFATMYALMASFLRWSTSTYLRKYWATNIN